MKTIQIHGETFEVKRLNIEKMQLLAINMFDARWTHKTLYECYERPSSAKVQIFNHWMRFFSDVDNVHNICITSYNTFRFSIGAILHDTDENMVGIFHITPTHNYLYFLEVL